MQDDILWGIDLGGTKIEGVVLRPKEPTNPIARLRIPTEAEGGYEHICHRISLLLDQMKAESGLYPTSLGIGIPGAPDGRTDLVKNANTTSLIGKPFRADLERLLQTPIVMANDANCFALAETHLGAVAQLELQPESVFGIIMGTGVGSGLVVHGQIVKGRHGIAGEWGHNTLIPDGEQCYCGKKGCVETVISGPALERFYTSITGNQRSLKSIMGQLETDEAAQQTLERLLDYFGQAVATVINIVDPDVIVCGGGVGNIPQLVSEGASRALPHVFNERVDTIFLSPELGDSAGVFGAAFLTAKQ